MSTPCFEVQSIVVEWSLMLERVLSVAPAYYVKPMMRYIKFLAVHNNEARTGGKGSAVLYPQ